MFSKFDRDRSGTLERDEVATAICSLGNSLVILFLLLITPIHTFTLSSPNLPKHCCLGYDLSAQATSILFNRFAKHRRYMNIDDFAACLSRVKIMDGKWMEWCI